MKRIVYSEPRLPEQCYRNRTVITTNYRADMDCGCDKLHNCNTEGEWFQFSGQGGWTIELPACLGLWHSPFFYRQKND